MSIRRSLALNVAPLGLRLALGLTFIWAGVGKIAHTTAIDDPQQLALLAEWEQIGAVASVIPDPYTDPQIDPQTGPATDPKSDPGTDTEIPGTDNDPIDETDIPKIEDQIDDEPAPQDPPTDPTPADPDPATDPVTDPETDPETDPATDDTPPPADEAQPVDDSNAIPVSFTQHTTTVEVKRVLKLALKIHQAANPGVDDAGKQQMTLWPKALSTGSLPVVVAWVVAILELVCGAALLSGFFTRMACLPIIGSMLAAIWLTQVGPAIQSGNAVIGFLPQGIFDIGIEGPAYAALLWQFALAAMGFAMLLIGPGYFSIDRLIFGVSTSAREEEARQVEFVPMGD